jgi:pyruvate/2-oxoglutarate dehydrogenase complex dihydrolipoamide acyltransferase (E2) component
MAVEILLPQVGASIQQASVTRWFTHDGDRVTEGETLCMVEADGSTKTIKAPGTGTLKINASTETSYEVGTVLGYIG